jgi:hypothetical protein
MPQMGDLAAQDQYVPEGPAGDLTPWDTLKRYASFPRRTIEGAIGDLATLPKRLYGASEQMRTEGSYNPGPAIEAALLPMGTGAVAGVKAAPGEAVLGAGLTRKVKGAPTAEAPGEILKPADVPISGANIPGTAGGNENIAARYVTNPIRLANPGVYKRPDVIASEAAAQVLPEHPALKQLFGVTRQDLYDISQLGRRQGNVEPELWMPGKTGKINEAAAAVMNPANEQRILDTLSEAYKHPELVKGMVPWYVMDPAYKRMVELVGPERAAAEYTKFNMHMTPFSGGSDVLTEINRGTAARMMSERNMFPQFQRESGKPPAERSADVRELLSDVKGHLMHKQHAAAIERYLATGEHGFDKNTVKIPLYTLASGVPQTGFQTRWAVPDTHFASAIGMPEVRTANDYRSFMGGPEYRPAGPWFREKIANPLGIEAVPTQALTWGTFAPQTGVRTGVGAGKLELLSQRIWERAKKLGVDPREFRDQVLRGEQHSELEDDNTGMGSLASMSRYG